MSWGMNNNPYGTRPQTYNTNIYNLPHYESPTLHGRAEANAFPMGPNSSIFLPDYDQNLIWWIRTDMYGNRTIDPFDISPHQELPPVNLNELETRLTNVEEWINHAKSNKSNAKRNANTANAIPPTTNTTE